MTTRLDADLLSLCRRYMSLERRQNRLFEVECAAQEAGDMERSKRCAWLQRRFVPTGMAMADEIHGCEAQTVAGLRAKAEVAMTFVTHNSDGTPCHDDLPLWSLCYDVLAMAERGQA